MDTDRAYLVKTTRSVLGTELDIISDPEDDSVIIEDADGRQFRVAPDRIEALILALRATRDEIDRGLRNGGNL